jgi:hypothetical protein
MPDGRLKNYTRNYVSLVRDAWPEEIEMKEIK